MTERATAANWHHCHTDGWTYEQVKELDLPFDWELVDGVISPRGCEDLWHDCVRDNLRCCFTRALHAPRVALTQPTLILGTRTFIRPDIAVFDTSGLSVLTDAYLPVARAELVVEVVSPLSLSEDRYRRPGLFSEAGVPFHWRVERGADGIPVLREFRLDGRAGTYEAAADRPFPIAIDLTSLLEL
ncbi:Uma2 family endonuclease [Streptomyces rimosus]|uniref:Uma2 family endonuclease n=1 Tax=Streptomyces rimosus TaxID=1927 RepID=UPI0004C6E395|nr:Uma2 family endonuclease [Streptomyces rimosus]